MMSATRYLLGTAVVVAGLSSPILGAAPAVPRVFSLDAERLAEGRRRAGENDDRAQRTLAQLRREGEQSLRAGPFSVMDKTLTPPSGDKHDYLSFGPYWWPDPAKPDGLPYIRRDGEVNPQSTGGASDRPALEAMTSAVETLALAYYFTGEERYAERAGRLLRVWFIDDATRMNPHLRFGQAIPGRVEGRGIGIIDTRRMPAIVDAIGLLDGSPHWRREDQQEMVRWMARYLEWLTASPYGTDEGRERNNHGTWYDVQVVALALFVDHRDAARRVVEAVPAKRIAAQIEPDGRQPYELARTRSFDYSVMNLAGMFELATLASRVDVKLWRAGTREAARLQAALDYLLDHSAGARTWPHQQITPVNRQRLRPLLWRAAILSNESRYDEAIRRLDAAAETDRCELLWPQ